eukprot:SAG11_NODE_1500_length_4787_cov_1.409556_2_plen_324_part_00
MAERASRYVATRQVAGTCACAHCCRVARVQEPSHILPGTVQREGEEAAPGGSGAAALAAERLGAQPPRSEDAATPPPFGVGTLRGDGAVRFEGAPLCGEDWGAGNAANGLLAAAVEGAARLCLLVEELAKVYDAGSCTDDARLTALAARALEELPTTRNIFERYGFLHDGRWIGAWCNAELAPLLSDLSYYLATAAISGEASEPAAPSQPSSTQESASASAEKVSSKQQLEQLLLAADVEGAIELVLAKRRRDRSSGAAGGGGAAPYNTVLKFAERRRCPVATLQRVVELMATRGVEPDAATLPYLDRLRGIERTETRMLPDS